jgi:hypothetical protein
MTKRQSTTAKLTRTRVEQLDAILERFQVGFIVRHRGQEYGVVNIVGDTLKLVDGAGNFLWVYYSQLTISKTNDAELTFPLLMGLPMPMTQRERKAIDMLDKVF